MATNDYEMSYFLPPITNKVPVTTMTLGEVAQVIGSEELAPQTRLLRSIADKAEARAYKGRSLPYVTPAGIFTYCNDASLVSHSRVLCIDLDGVGDVDGLKRLLTADGHFCTLMAFRSPSGNGLKWMVKIDLARADHRSWYHAVRNYLLKSYGDRLTPKMVDSQCQNLSRACFLCHDPEVYLNLGAEKPALPFDPTVWAAAGEPQKKPAATQSRPATACQPASHQEELARATAVAYELMRRGANIAEQYDDYVKLGFSLANGLGSDGRRLYHLLCSQSTKYQEAACEGKWNECLSKSDGRTTIATYYQMAKQAGVNLKDYCARGERV